MRCRTGVSEFDGGVAVEIGGRPLVAMQGWKFPDPCIVAKLRGGRRIANHDWSRCAACMCGRADGRLAWSRC